MRFQSLEKKIYNLLNKNSTSNKSGNDSRILQYESSIKESETRQTLLEDVTDEDEEDEEIDDENNEENNDHDDEDNKDLTVSCGELKEENLDENNAKKE